MPLEQRRNMIDRTVHCGVSMRRQCELLTLHRSGLYYAPVPESDENLRLMALMDIQYLHTPFYGKRRLTEWLETQGWPVNIKRVERLMQVMGWQTIYRKPNTSKASKDHPVYPYLLRDIKIVRPNQAWATDITYVPMHRGYLYLCAVIDLYTRYVVGWNISNAMTAQWVCDVVNDAVLVHEQPEIINSDQGSQYTSQEYISLLTKREKPIRISMDGKGRCIDNVFIERLWRSVKYECVYLHMFEDGVQLYRGLEQYFSFYNNERLHQSLAYATPASIYYAVTV